MAIGVPGWPDFAACTASIASVRMVLMVRRSRSLADMTRIRSGLAISASPSPWICCARLDGDFAIVARVVGEVHGGHAAGAQLALERVAVGHRFLQAMKRISHEGKIWTDYSFATAFNEPIAALASRPAPWPASIARAPRRGRA